MTATRILWWPQSISILLTPPEATRFWLQINQSSQTIQVTNGSPLDLQIQNYALIQGTTLTEVAGPTLIPAGGSVSLPLPANSDGLAFACEAQLALPPSMDVAAVTKYLNFRTVDVQNTQYLVGLNAAGVDFTKVASVQCTVTLPTLPSVAPWQTTLTANLHSRQPTHSNPD